MVLLVFMSKHGKIPQTWKSYSNAEKLFKREKITKTWKSFSNMGKLLKFGKVF